MVPFVPLDMVLPISESAFLCPENRWTFIVLNSRQLRNFPYISLCFYLHFRLYARAHGPEVEVGGFQAWRMHFLSLWRSSDPIKYLANRELRRSSSRR